MPKIGAGFHALIRLDTLKTLRGAMPGGEYAEAVAFAEEHLGELKAEWSRLNERD